MSRNNVRSSHLNWAHIDLFSIFRVGKNRCNCFVLMIWHFRNKFCLESYFSGISFYAFNICTT